MNCYATRAVLDLHADKRLTSGGMKSVSAHLESCAECRALAAAPNTVAVKAPEAGFKRRLAAAMKAGRNAPAARPVHELPLWPRDLSGVVFAAVALALAAVIIGWSGAPSQRDISGDHLELAGGGTP